MNRQNDSVGHVERILKVYDFKELHVGEDVKSTQKRERTGFTSIQNGTSQSRKKPKLRLGISTVASVSVKQIETTSIY